MLEEIIQSCGEQRWQLIMEVIITLVDMVVAVLLK
jgi:hypothetical protein